MLKTSMNTLHVLINSGLQKARLDQSRGVEVSNAGWRRGQMESEIALKPSWRLLWIEWFPLLKDMTKS